MDRRREILVGKLAIGRRAISREDAVRCFHAATTEPFWELAVREGLLPRAAAEALVAAVERGDLVCRGKCGARRALGTLEPGTIDRCPFCGGPVYVGRSTTDTPRTSEPPRTPGGIAEGPASGGRSDPALKSTVKTAGSSGAVPVVVRPESAGAPIRPAAPAGPGPVTPASPSTRSDSSTEIAPPQVTPTTEEVRASNTAAASTTSLPENMPPMRPVRPGSTNGGKTASTLPSPPIPSTVPSQDQRSTDSLPSAIKLAGRTPSGTPSSFREAEPRKAAPKGQPDFVPFALGSYDVLAPLGKGGMGAVYRARQRTLKRQVALKILSLSAEDQRRRFEREIRATAGLNHPNIVRVLGGGVVSEGETKGQPYFAMELVDGRDLLTWYKERPRTPQECAAMTAILCDAMHFAHDHGIVHRDLKPQNVLVCYEGDVPKICDFGLARVASEGNLTRTGDIMGTPQYMPPEQILGDRKRIGRQTDVYALGALLYHLLTGGPPFNARKIFTLTAMVVRDPPVPPRQKNAQVSEALESCVLKCLEKDPARRFPTALELGKALRSVAMQTAVG